jgi:hypothetical protein
MVKVKDTAQFIKRAREVHGDRYDYSQSVWAGADKPITYKCQKCGKVTQTYNARKHICEKQKSGCKTCYRKKWDSKEVREQLKLRPCAVCGAPINDTDKRKVTCGKDCGNESRKKEKLVKKCIICGKKSLVYPSGVKEVNCCSLSCQREWALNRNRGGVGIHADWLARSKKARFKWIRNQSSLRKKSSVGRQFWLLCKIEREPETSAWKRRCATSAATLNTRFVGKIKTRKKIRRWSECLRASSRKLTNKHIRESVGVWEWKISSVASGLRRRKRKKLLQRDNRNISKHIKQLVQQPKQLSFW